MISKVKNFFEKLGNLDESQKNKFPNEPAINSEFQIKYHRNRVSIPRLPAIGETLVDNSEGKFDVMAYLIHCPKHDTIAIYSPNYTNNDFNIKWLPFTPLFAERSWTESALDGSLLILSNEQEEVFLKLKQDSPFSEVRLVEILRIQLPQTLSFLTRFIFYLKLKPYAKNFSCCTNYGQIEWVSLKEISDHKVEKLWGLELIFFAKVIQSNFQNFIEQIQEFSLDDVYLYSPRDPPRNAEETMLLELNISEKTIEILYNDFLDHCYPCFALPIESFKYYMSKYGFHRNDERLNQLFQAFNYKRNGHVSFHELLLGLVAIEPNASHHDTRVKFIYRFYDSYSKGYLDMENFEKLVGDVFANLHGKELIDKFEESVNVVGSALKDNKTVIPFNNFLKAIQTHKFRGTSKLCRSTVPVFLQLTRAFIHKKKPTIDNLKEWGDLNAVLLPRVHKGSCIQCKSINYRLATHAVELDSNGYITNPSRIINKHSNKVFSKETLRSIEFLFNPSSISNVLLKMLREFNEKKGNVTAPKGLLESPSDRKLMFEMLTKLTEEAKTIFKNESRCPNVSSPCFVIGDIHGNLEDLLTLERLLWKNVPCLGPNYLFLGDYVDRGKWGFECALYLIAFKLIDPKKVTLLRGNHEVRNLQEKYTYKKECLRKYGDDLGDRIWQLTNQVFDLFPIAATIDNLVFCTHGGISPNAPTLKQIRELPVNLNDPEHQSKIAWELIWSDPCHIQQYLEIIEMNETANNNEFAQEGYVYNQKRGAAFLFNERAATTFLNRNGLTHMIRAHEVPPYGFTHHFNNICTTVFSCSHYCSYDNEASCILIHNSRIRVIRIDTHNNAPATEK